MVYAWGTNQRNSCTTMTITVNSVDRNYIQNFSSQCFPFINIPVLILTWIHLRRKLSTKKTRHSSVASHPASMRHSRSHSPSIHPKQPSKRRNTMNSRDAAFDQSLQEIIEATAAEAAAIDPSLALQEDKKRKRTDDDPSIRYGSASNALCCF